MSERPDTRNEISGAVIGNVIQGRDIAVSLPTATPVAVSGLPAQPAFVGRHAELARLAKALDPATADAPDSPMIVSAIAGLPGVGKTAIVVRAAHDAIGAGWLPGGVLMVDLRGYDPPDRRVLPTTALASMLGALGIPNERIPADQPDRERLWRSLLANRDAAGQRTLVILDNAFSAEQVRPLLPGIGKHRVLITSRHNLADLDGARLFEIAVLSADHAVELLQQALTAADPEDDRVRTDPQAARRLGQLCGGLPLAIRIAAALLAADPDQPVAELTETLAAEQHRLEELNYDGSLSVRSAFDLSYQHLAPGTAQLFRLLVLNPSPEVSTEAAASLAGLDVAEGRRLIGQLRRAHLVQPGATRGRWRMHDLLRLYAAERATNDETRDPALDRLLRYYVTTSEAAISYIDTSAVVSDSRRRFTSQRQALNWLDIERPNLVGAVTLAYDTERYVEAVALSNTLYEFLSLRLHVNDLLTTHQLALVAARRMGDRSSEGRIHHGLSMAFWRLSMHVKAKHHCQRALEIYRKLDDRHGEARALLSLGHWHGGLNEHEDSLVCYSQALEIYRELGDRRGEAGALNGIGLHHALRKSGGHFEDAADYYRQALRIAREIGDRDAEAGKLGNLGNLHSDLEQWQQALHCHREALDIWRSLDYRHGQAGQMNNLGSTYRGMGEWADAAECWQEAAELYGECQDHHAEAGVLHHLGQVYRQLDRLDQAITCYRQSLLIRRQLGTVEGEAETLADLGDALHETGQLDAAVAYWVEALDKFTELDDTHARIAQLRTALSRTDHDS
ncbi:tetratricopeptide repeat protein [Amycolatopsis sp. NPDC049688]|uniref:ATP-binding protein n=1 Tax=Amycolatopsis sp. NPDC049688 TaxID=3154733 RepID=UPI00341DCC16